MERYTTRSILWRAVAIALIAGVALLFSSPSGNAENAFGNPKRGQQIYERLCTRCHGVKLDGRGPDAPSLRSAPADLQSLSSRTKSDWELLIIISYGVMYTPMHGYRDLLTEQDIKDVLSFIRMEAPFKPLA
ncbi:MAG: cytochrome c [Nitrospirota bacterium]